MKPVAPALALACSLFAAGMLGACQQTDRGTGAMPAESTSTGPMPVVDVSALMNPGYWEASGTVTMKAMPGGKTGTYTFPSEKTCITAALLEDFLNADDIHDSMVKNFALLDPEVSYFFRGRHLQADLKFKVGGPEHSKVVLDWYFDDPDHAHEYGHMRMTTGNGILVSSTHLKYRRISATCPGSPDAETIPVVDVSGLMNTGYWKTTGEIHETRNGKPVARPPDDSVLATCITAADLKDILHSGFAGMDLGKWGAPGTLDVASSLHGPDLHVVVQGSPAHLDNHRLEAKTVRDTHFDDPDHSRTTIHQHHSLTDDDGKHTRSLTLTMKSRRVSATCPGEPGDPQSAVRP